VRFGDRRLAFAAALIAVLASACREKPAPAAEVSRPAGSAPPAAALPPGHPAVDAAPPAAVGAADTGSVSGTVAVAPGLKARAAGGVLFVIARSAATRQIVAVRREEIAGFPAPFRISGADAMFAGTAFAGPLDLTARLSKSGDAVAGKGDVEGVVRGVNVGESKVQLTLDTVHE
jgi:cytochrome c-type biogenesis protein CcmH